MSAIRIFKNSRVIDGNGNDPVENGCFIIDGPKIIHAGKDGGQMAAKYPLAEVIDLKGMTLMPGLIDAHMHLSLHGSPSYFNEMIMESPTLKDKALLFQSVSKENAELCIGFGCGPTYRGIN